MGFIICTGSTANSSTWKDLLRLSLNYKRLLSLCLILDHKWKVIFLFRGALKIITVNLSLLQYNLYQHFSCLQSIGPDDSEDLSSRAELRETFCIFHESSALKLHIRYSAHLGLLKCSIYPQFHRYWSWEYLFWWDKWLIEEAGAFWELGSSCIEIFFPLNIVRSKYLCLNMLLDQHNYILLSSAQVLSDVDIFI